MRWKTTLALVAVIVAGYLFFAFYFDGFVKKQVEAAGSAAVGAKVELKGLSISFLRQSVTLSGLQVADPGNPWNNLFTLRSANFDFDLGAAAMGHIVIENVSADTPMWGTRRDTWGGIEKKPEPPPTPSKGLGIDWKAYIPPMELPKDFDPVKYVKPETMASIKTIEAGVKYFEGRDKYWADRYQALSAEYESIKSSLNITVNTPQDVLKAVEAIKKIDEFRKKVEAARDDMQKDMNRADATRKEADRLYNEDLKNIGGLFGAESAKGGFAQQALAELYRGKLGRMYARYNAYRAEINKRIGSKTGADAEPKKQRMKGTTVEFPVLHPLPLFWVKRAAFTANAEAKSGNWFSGEMRNLSSGQKVINQPLTVDMKGGSQDLPGAEFAINGSLDFRGDKGKMELGMTAGNIATNLAENSLGDNSPVGITGGTAVFTSALQIVGDRINSDFNFTLKEIAMATRKQSVKALDPKVTAILDDSLKSVHYLNLKGEAKGAIDALDVSITSDIDKIFGEVMRKAWAGLRVEAEARIRAEMDKEFKKRLGAFAPGLTGPDGQLKNMDQLVNEQHQRLDKERKKYEDAAKGETEKAKAELDKRKKEEEQKLKAAADKRKKEEEDKLKQKLKDNIKLPF